VCAFNIIFTHHGMTDLQNVYTVYSYGLWSQRINKYYHWK